LRRLQERFDQQEPVGQTPMAPETIGPAKQNGGNHENNGCACQDPGFFAQSRNTFDRAFILQRHRLAVLVRLFGMQGVHGVRNRARR